MQLEREQAPDGTAPALRGGAHERLCVGCRRHDERAALLRLVLAGDPPQAVPDVARSARGRGVSVHATRSCLQAAVRTGAVRRGLKASVETTADQLIEWSAGQYTRRLESLIVAAVRANKAVIGSERVREALRATAPALRGGASMSQRRVALLVVARDAGEGQQDLVRAAERLGNRCVLHGDKAGLGRLLGRELSAVIAISDAALAAQVRSAADSLSALGTDGAEVSALTATPDAGQGEQPSASRPGISG